MNFISEVWKEYHEADWVEKDKFLISNYGRIKSLKKSKKGTLIKGGNLNGYLAINATRKNGKRISRYVHKIVAELFLEPIEGKRYVLHLDYQKTNNHISNLRYANEKERAEHHKNNPNIQKDLLNPSYSKLSYSDVLYLKKKLLDPKRKTRIKLLAKQFGVSEMQLWRIKSGENWGHVKVSFD